MKNKVNFQVSGSNVSLGHVTHPSFNVSGKPSMTITSNSPSCWVSG